MQSIPPEITTAAASMLSPYVPGLTPDKLETAIHFPDEEPSDKLRTRAEAKQLLNVSMPTIDRMLAAGELPRCKVRGRVMIPQSAITSIMKGEVLS